MKLITAIVNKEDSKNVCNELIKAKFYVTRLRTEIVPGTASIGVGLETAMPIEVTVGGATIFVTNVERFEKL